jgi:hypothetical protein
MFNITTPFSDLTLDVGSLAHFAGMTSEIRRSEHLPDRANNISKSSPELLMISTLCAATFIHQLRQYVHV